MSKIYAFILGVALISMGSCNIINPTEPTPTYIHIDSFTLTPTPALGSNSHAIKVAFVYLNSQTIGIFDLPVTFPVLLDQPGKIAITPGIFSNGLSGNPVQYPYYVDDTFTLNPNPGQVLNRAAVSKYYSFTKVLYYVDFDGSAPGTAGAPNPFINLSGDTTIGRTSDPAQVFEGAHSGLISLTNGKDSSENVNTNPVALTPSTDLFMEIDYKCSVPFTVGLSTQVSGIYQYAYLVGFYPNGKWAKAYIPLRQFVSVYQGTSYNILLRAIKDAGTADGYVLIDNIKIVGPQ